MKNNTLKISVTIFSMLLCFGVFAQGQGGGQRGGKQKELHIIKRDGTGGVEWEVGRIPKVPKCILCSYWRSNQQRYQRQGNEANGK